MAHPLAKFSSETLEMLLDDKRLSIPWEGTSPRALTQGFKLGILKAQAGGCVSEVADPRQLCFWVPVKRAPWVYQGAQLLIPLEGA